MTKLVAADPPDSRRVADSVPGRVLTALRGEARPVRPVELARKVGLPTQVTASALLSLCKSGEAIRTRNPRVPNGPGSSVYEATPWE